MNEEKNALNIEELKKRGFNRWTKGDMDRLYFDVKKSEYFSVDYYKSGNVSSAYLEGERISNAEAYRIMSVKCFIDLKNNNELVVQYGNEESQKIVRELAKKAMN